MEILGSYDARNAEAAKFDNPKILDLISKGAQTSDTVNNLLISRGLIEGKKRNVLSRRPLVREPELVAAPEPAPEAVSEEPKVEETPAA